MNTKRISAELSGDTAIKHGILLTTTRLDKESKKDADSKFCELSVLCVEKITQMCSNASGVQYPSYDQLLQFLTDKETVVDLPQHTTDKT